MSTTTNKYLSHWREYHKNRPYANRAASFDEYEPAYAGHGVTSNTRYRGRSFEDINSDLAQDWNASRVTPALAWERARFAARNAWDYVRTRR